MEVPLLYSLTLLRHRRAGFFDEAVERARAAGLAVADERSVIGLRATLCAALSIPYSFFFRAQ